MLPIGNAWHWLSVAIVLFCIWIMLYRTCLTLRWVMAVLAIVICCMGNDYPATTQNINQSVMRYQ